MAGAARAAAMAPRRATNRAVRRTRPPISRPASQRANRAVLVVPAVLVVRRAPVRRSRPVVGEAITDAVDREDEARNPRIRLELAADVLDVGVDCPLVRFEGNPVKSIEQLRAGEDPARLGGQGRQQLELGWCQLDLVIAELSSHPKWVENELARPDDRLVASAPAIRPVDTSQDGLDSSDELAGLNGLVR